MSGSTLGADEEEVIKLNGREVAVGMRVLVCYEQEDGKVEYHGTVSRVSNKLGMRVWFDHHSHTEQEWVNNEDEWRFEDADPALNAEHAAPQDAEDADEEENEDAACEFQRIQLKLGKLTHLVTKANKPKRKRATADAAADKGADGAVAASTDRPAVGMGGGHVRFRMSAAGITASENDHSPFGTSMPHLKAPRRTAPTWLAKYGRCELSDAVAIYKDPCSGARFGSSAAFRALRARQMAEEPRSAARAESVPTPAKSAAPVKSSARTGRGTAAR